MIKEPPVSVITLAMVSTSVFVNCVSGRRSRQSGSLIHHRLCRSERVKALWTALKAEGKEASFLRKDSIPLKYGFQRRAVSAPMRMASTRPMAGPRGHPHPSRKVPSPAASRTISRPERSTWARVLVASWNLPGSAAA